MNANFYFYLFFILVAFCALLIIISRNPVQSVFFLILIFLLTAVLFILIGAEFLAIAVLTIYVGAVSILFLFVVMMLNLRILELHSSFYHHVPIGSFIGLFYVAVSFSGIIYNFGEPHISFFTLEDYFALPNYLNYVSNTAYIGYVLYNFYSFFVLISALILLIAMVGAIILTVDFEYRAVKRNNLFTQVLDRSEIKYWL